MASSTSSQAQTSGDLAEGLFGPRPANAEQARFLKEETRYEAPYMQSYSGMSKVNIASPQPKKQKTDVTPTPAKKSSLLANIIFSAILIAAVYFASPYLGPTTAEMIDRVGEAFNYAVTSYSPEPSVTILPIEEPTLTILPITTSETPLVPVWDNGDNSVENDPIDSETESFLGLVSGTRLPLKEDDTSYPTEEATTTVITANQVTTQTEATASMIKGFRYRERVHTYPNSFDRLLTVCGDLSDILSEHQIWDIAEHAFEAHEDLSDALKIIRLSQTDTVLVERNEELSRSILRFVQEVLISCLQIKKENFVFGAELEYILTTSKLQPPDKRALGESILALQASAPGYKEMLQEKVSMLEAFELEIDNTARDTMKDNLDLFEKIRKEDLMRDLNANSFNFPWTKGRGEDKIRNEKLISTLRRTIFLDQFVKNIQKLRAQIHDGISLLDGIVKDKEADGKLAKRGVKVDAKRHVPVLEDAYREAVARRKNLEKHLIRLESSVSEREGGKGR
ncbi:uncharacterized protein LY89DRAFT_742927 [Mollisia scopiformis]|uniref:Uncharacterized protein n=1 Tax=Mollisia scopiformis TaxID=149040 RepID=A0A132B4F4_MOLSC|nr:uncharacterized protein LY89DRAFT_742927 [Mollisia scopiformis]KUJ07280.1 hypothetical protein LY89DRAFT_742927 [Mollisia scopiformis]